jgi:hypothetical protein
MEAPVSRIVGKAILAAKKIYNNDVSSKKRVRPARRSVKPSAS